MTDNLQKKAVDAFKGVIRTYKLVSTQEEFEDANYVDAWKVFYAGDKSFELFYKKKEYDRLVDCTDRLFDNQTDKNSISEYILDAVTKWIEQGYKVRDNHPQLEQMAIDFLDKVKQGIKNQMVYIALEGIKFENLLELPLARCQLCCNHPESEFMKVVQRDKERFAKSPEEPSETYSRMKEASAFLKVNLSGHYKRVVQKSRIEANLALNVLRLFIGSYYMDVYVQRARPRRMGIIGTLPIAGQRSNVFFAQADIPLETQYPGQSVQIEHWIPFDLTWEFIEGLSTSPILSRLNDLLCSLETANKLYAGRRLLRTVNWFGKASEANSIAESFLMYAIAIEALLSDGRTSKETYARRIASLYTRQDIDIIYPWEKHLSIKFANELNSASSENDRFVLIEKRVIDLFTYRNEVAHGMVVEDEIEPIHVLDLEILARISILSFVDGGWDTLEEFKIWMKNNISHLTPPPTSP